MENAQTSRTGIILAGIFCLTFAAWPSAAAEPFLELFGRAQKDSLPVDAASDYTSAIANWTSDKGQTLLAACYLGRAKAEYSLGKLDEAALDAAQCFSLDAGNRQALVVQGMALLASGRYAAAEKKFAQAAVSRRDNEEAYYYLGQTQSRMSNFPWALKNLTKAESLNPADFRPVLSMAEVWRRQDRCDKAVLLYQKARDLSAMAQAQSSAGMGYCAYQEGNFPKALDDYDQALASQNSSLGDLIRGQAPAYQQKELQDELARTYFWRGMDYSRLNRVQDADADYAKSCGLGYRPACAFVHSPQRSRVISQKSKKKKIIYSGPPNSAGDRIYAQ